LSDYSGQNPVRSYEKLCQGITAYYSKTPHGKGLDP
jgi:hypothetical protein